ncbi:MAG: DUF4860 domain-containing protein [Lachnospiraceae bacterium]|nr:DUF4860 domain-containing protein [Candidatus Merdinaster equi]
MRSKKENRHVVDVLFVVILFCIFAFCSLILVVFGAEVYEKTMEHMDNNYIERTAYAYISEKIRQNDMKDAVSVEQFGDDDAIFLKNNYADKDYYTVLYVDDGWLKELFTADPYLLGAKAGTSIYECEGLKARWEEEELLNVLVKTKNGEQEIYAAIRSESQGE